MNGNEVTASGAQANSHPWTLERAEAILFDRIVGAAFVRPASFTFNWRGLDVCVEANERNGMTVVRVETDVRNIPFSIEDRATRARIIRGLTREGLASEHVSVARNRLRFVAETILPDECSLASLWAIVGIVMVAAAPTFGRLDALLYQSYA